jgi:hypothetical protein
VGALWRKCAHLSFFSRTGLVSPQGWGSERLYFPSLFVDGDYLKLKFLPKTFPYVVSRICILVTGDSVYHASMLREMTMRWIWLAPS